MTDQFMGKCPVCEKAIWFSDQNAWECIEFERVTAQAGTYPVIVHVACKSAAIEQNKRYVAHRRALDAKMACTRGACE